MKIIQSLNKTLFSLSKEERKNIVFCGLTLFFTLFTYPIVRAPAEAIFIHSNGASKSPLVWFFSLIALALTIALFNKFQNSLHIHKLYKYSLLFFSGMMIIFSLLYKFHNPLWSYPLFIGKEVYIVILVHLAMGYMNSYVSVDVAKTIYGPLGAVNALGGILGGLLTSQLTSSFEPVYILLIGFGILFISLITFSLTDKEVTIENSAKDKKVENPVSSIEGVVGYVSLIAAVILVTQFCISLMNFKFNLVLGESIISKMDKTKYFAQIFTYVNSLSFAVQILLVPFLLKAVSLKKVHVGIPVFYSIIVLAGFLPFLSPLLSVSAGFIIFKGLDYSLFSSAKEILYFPLTTAQKYGAKYIVDMFVYRFGKGFISLLLIFVQGIQILNILLIIFLIMWIILIIFMFKYSPKKV